MQRGFGMKNGKPLVLLGLDPQNLSRMREGQPIQVNLRHLNPDGPPVEELPDLDVVIYFAGETETALMKSLMKGKKS